MSNCRYIKRTDEIDKKREGKKELRHCFLILPKKEYPRIHVSTVYYYVLFIF